MSTSVSVDKEQALLATPQEIHGLVRDKLAPRFPELAECPSTTALCANPIYRSLEQTIRTALHTPGGRKLQHNPSTGAIALSHPGVKPGGESNYYRKAIGSIPHARRSSLDRDRCGNGPVLSRVCSFEISSFQMKRVYLSLGSNVGDRAARIRKALGMLAEEEVNILRVSSFYETEPVDFFNQPWFVNCVAEAESELMPLQLLRRCQAVERALGRRPGVAKGPRPIDIDILLYDNAVVRSSQLVIPHQRMEERRFVLVPLRELAPQTRHPVTQRTVSEMLQDTPDKAQVVRLGTE